MAIKPVIQLKNQAQLIKNETTPSANTATRIGQELLDIVDTFAAEIIGHPPYISEDGFWYQWDMELSQYVNTNIKAEGSSGVAVSDVAPTDPQVKVWMKPGGVVPEFATKSDLDGKADLAPTTQTVPPAQISPLQGLQTGFNATDGFYRSTAPALLFKGSRTVEALIKLGPNPTANETVFDMRGDAGNIRIDIQPNNLIRCYSGGGFSQIQGIEGEYYHIAIRLDSGNNTSTLFINGVQVQTINSNIGNPSYFNIGGYSSAGSHKFRGIINNLRTFNYAFSDSECLSLWNGGRPNEYMLPGTGSMRDGLIGEFLPCGLLPDKWRDTSGNGLDLTAVGTPQLCYETVPDMAVNTLAVTVTGTAATPVYSFTQSNFAQVSNAVSNGSEPIVKITDSRTTANKPVDLSGVYPAMWNASLNQIENRDLARGFYLNGITPASRPARSSMTDTYVLAGINYRHPEWACKFNQVTGFYEMNTIVDLTESDIAKAYEYKTSLKLQSLPTSYYTMSLIRTNFPLTPPMYSNARANLDGICSYSNAMEVFNLIPSAWFDTNGFTDITFASNVTNAFYYNHRLVKILGIIDVSLITFPISTSDFRSNVLEDFKIRGLKLNADFGLTPKLNKESLIYLLTNRANAVATPITVTLHPTVFAWASVDSEVQALLGVTATQGAVTLVSA